MKNPFRTEESAFRFLVLTIAYGALIVIGSKINTWIGLAVFVVETAIVAWWLLTQGRREQPILQAPASHPAGERRILVIANETVGGGPLLNEIRRRSEGVNEHVLVVVPALNSPLKHWVSDEDGAREAAQQRLEASLATMREAGIDATGEVGDGDPLQAIEDALRTFAPDELVISTHPEGKSNWLERGVVEGARQRFALPVTHVVVDLNAQS
jgi:nucleotide-binding universal stress UspA family protein